ncbi:MAG: hypothetical protein RJA70_618 [Pseudomonadota bacterium]|jgi:ribulose-phosphate 3-epimerase
MLNSVLSLAPSILSADFGRLADEIQEVEAAGAELIHVDVMDGSFVPNISVGLPIVEAARKATHLPIDVHLMIVQPEKYLADFARAGADIISFHVEASTHAQRALNQIRELGKRAGLALNPHTHESCLDYLLDDLDMVMLMTVNPGFSGQKFLPSQLSKILRVSEKAKSAAHMIDVQVDGGVNAETIGAVVKAGANIVVAGNAVFGQRDRGAALRGLRQAAAAHG